MKRTVLLIVIGTLFVAALAACTSPSTSAQTPQTSSVTPASTPTPDCRRDYVVVKKEVDRKVYFYIVKHAPLQDGEIFISSSSCGDYGRDAWTIREAAAKREKAAHPEERVFIQENNTLFGFWDWEEEIK